MRQNYLTFNFDDPQKDLNKIKKQFEKAGLTVIDASSDDTIKRMSGYPTKTLTVYFDDGQSVLIRIKKGGDVFQVKLNSTIIPVRNVSHLNKAVKEIALKVSGNSASWTKAQRRKQSAQKVNENDTKPRPVSRKGKIKQATQEVSELESLKLELEKENESLTAQKASKESEIAELEAQL